MSQTILAVAYLKGAQNNVCQRCMFANDAFDSEQNSSKCSDEESEAYNLVREAELKRLKSDHTSCVLTLNPNQPCSK